MDLREIRFTGKPYVVKLRETRGREARTLTDKTERPDVICQQNERTCPAGQRRAGVNIRGTSPASFGGANPGSGRPNHMLTAAGNAMRLDATANRLGAG